MTSPTGGMSSWQMLHSLSRRDQNPRKLAPGTARRTLRLPGPYRVYSTVFLVTVAAAASLGWRHRSSPGRS